MAAPTPISALMGGGLSAGGGGPSGASGTTTSGFDASGWAVNFGSGSAGASGSSDGFAGLMNGYTPYILGGLALLAVWRMSRKR